MRLLETVFDKLELVDIDPHDGCIGSIEDLLQGHALLEHFLPLPILVVAMCEVVNVRHELLQAQTDVIRLGFEHIKQHPVLNPLLQQLGDEEFLQGQVWKGGAHRTITRDALELLQHLAELPVCDEQLLHLEAVLVTVHLCGSIWTKSGKLLSCLHKANARLQPIHIVAEPCLSVIGRQPVYQLPQVAQIRKDGGCIRNGDLDVGLVLR